MFQNKGWLAWINLGSFGLYLSSGINFRLISSQFQAVGLHNRVLAFPRILWFIICISSYLSGLPEPLVIWDTRELAKPRFCWHWFLHLANMFIQVCLKGETHLIPGIFDILVFIHKQLLKLLSHNTPNTERNLTWRRQGFNSVLNKLKSG